MTRNRDLVEEDDEFGVLEKKKERPMTASADAADPRRMEGVNPEKKRMKRFDWFKSKVASVSSLDTLITWMLPFSYEKAKKESPLQREGEKGTTGW